MKIKEFLRPKSIEEAYELCCKGTVAVGGGGFLNLGDRTIESAMDLTNLDLDYIADLQNNVEIGAMTSLRTLETHPVSKDNFNGVLQKAISSIMGVQVRNLCTIGGSIYGKFGFSDIITTLLALNAEVVLYNAGSMSLESFLEGTFEKDILLKVVINKNVSKAAFACLRKTEADFSVLNAAAAIVEGQLRLSVGARPGKARLAKGAMSYFEPEKYGLEASEALAILGAEELQFGSDLRATSEYRKELCKTLIKRCAMEVLA